MDENCVVLETAAKMLGTESGLMHIELITTLLRADHLCHNNGRRLTSAPAIAAIIVSWEQANPRERSIPRDW